MKLTMVLWVVLISVAGISVYGQSTSGSNIVRVGIGATPASSDMYFDVPFDFWPNREKNLCFRVSYAREIHEYMRLGVFGAFEDVHFSDNSGGPVRSFSKSDIGLDWVMRYPKSGLNLQLGGFINMGFLKADNWDNLTGKETGIIIGPAYEKGRIGVSAHIHAGHGWFTSDGTPKGVMLYNWKYIFEVYYRL